MQKALTVKHTTEVFDDWTQQTFACTSAVQARIVDDQPDVIVLIISGHSITVVRSSLPALRTVIDALEAFA